MAVQVVADQGSVPDRRKPGVGPRDQEVGSCAVVLEPNLVAGVATAAAAAVGATDPGRRVPVVAPADLRTKDTRPLTAGPATRLTEGRVGTGRAPGA